MSQLPDVKIDTTSLVKEEVYTDQKIGSVRVLIPVTANGEQDESRAVAYFGQTQVMTQAGPLPLNFEIEGDRTSGKIITSACTQMLTFRSCNKHRQPPPPNPFPSSFSSIKLFKLFRSFVIWGRQHTQSEQTKCSILSPANASYNCWSAKKSQLSNRPFIRPPFFCRYARADISRAKKSLWPKRWSGYEQKCRSKLFFIANRYYYTEMRSSSMHDIVIMSCSEPPIKEEERLVLDPWLRHQISISFFIG